VALSPSEGEPLEVPVRSRENELVDLILLALSRNAAENGLHPIGWQTRIVKTAYYVAEELDLPITRSWFKFGAYVWTENAKEDRLNQFLGVLEPDPSINQIIEYAETDGREVYQSIRQVIDQNDFILKSNTSELLDWLYQNGAPKEYRGIYKSHKKVMDRIDRTLDSIWKSDASYQFANAAKEITDFHKQLGYFESRPDMIDLVIDATSLLESTLMVYESNVDNYDVLRRLATFLKPLYHDFYLGDIWKFPASGITLETVEGDGAEAVKKGLSSYLNKLEIYRNELGNWTERSFIEGYYPTEADIENVQKRLSSRLSSDESILRKFVYEGLEIDR
jgi:hypothetical protein